MGKGWVPASAGTSGWRTACPSSVSFTRAFAGASFFPCVLVLHRVLIPHDHQPIVAGLAAPEFARPALHLAYLRAALVARKRRESLGRRIEALDRVGRPIGRPYAVLVVDIDRVGSVSAL